MTGPNNAMGASVANGPNSPWANGWPNPNITHWDHTQGTTPQ